MLFHHIFLEFEIPFEQSFRSDLIFVFGSTFYENVSQDPILLTTDLTAMVYF